MNIAKSLLEHFRIIFKEARYLFYKPNKVFSRKDIPYFSQCASKKLLVEPITKTLPIHSDTKWRQTGAKSKQEYILWCANMCGMACLKMILAHRYKKTFKLVPLSKKCLEYGGYIDNSAKYDVKDLISHNAEVPFDYYDGLFYKPFLNFINKEFGLKGKIISPMIIEDILRALNKNKYVIASVSSDIRDSNLTPRKKGGHLVLITGYNLNKGELSLHNPSGYYKKSQEHYQISFKNFKKFFANRGVILE